MLLSVHSLLLGCVLPWLQALPQGQPAVDLAPAAALAALLDLPSPEARRSVPLPKQ